MLIKVRVVAKNPSHYPFTTSSVPAPIRDAPAREGIVVKRNRLAKAVTSNSERYVESY